MTINERLKMLRIEGGLTQMQLAHALNIAQTTIAAYEKSHDPNIYNLIAYADYFKCSLDFIVGRDSEAADLTLTAVTPEEKELLRIYRNLNGGLKNHLIEYSNLINNSNLNR